MVDYPHRDGARTFPANQYDVSGEYGNAPADMRHRFVLGGGQSGGNRRVRFEVRFSF